MTEQEMEYGKDFIIIQSKLKRGFNPYNPKGKRGRGRPRKEKRKYRRRQKK